ncbi:hypothetical protein ILUMI_05362 [Ignelater luminosus]|uniref:THAP-type domain-containing protein n=1 Tax=Ignelater luminosus TaxID=2038154 RepID=A0A8K0GK63_IGNLU|nr:hypothetical protein ILUMI_05362 [Ignelater luminosus]
MVYKWCVVPQCTNTSIKTPEKMFVPIPKNTKIRKKWLMLARRNPKDIAASTNAFMREDHFNTKKMMNQETKMYLRSRETLNKPQRLDDSEMCYVGITELDEPLTFEEAMNCEKVGQMKTCGQP